MICATMRRGTSWALLLATGALLSGCVYDPYTGGYYPCCNTYPPARYYRYPQYPYQPQSNYQPPSGYTPQSNYSPADQTPQYPYPPPSNYPPPDQSPYAQPMPQPRSEAPTAPRAGNLVQRFASANVTQDGRLTQDQAQAAGWRYVARNFAAIDSGQKGYLTLDDIRSWATAHRRVPGTPAQPAG